MQLAHIPDSPQNLVVDEEQKEENRHVVSSHYSSVRRYKHSHVVDIMCCWLQINTGGY